MPTHALDEALLDRLRTITSAAAGPDGSVVLTDPAGRPVFTLAGPPPREAPAEPADDAAAGAAADREANPDPTGFRELERYLRNLPEDPYAEFQLDESSADIVRDIRVSMERGGPRRERTASQIIAELEARERASGDGTGGTES